MSRFRYIKDFLKMFINFLCYIQLCILSFDPKKMVPILKNKIFHYLWMTWNIWKPFQYLESQFNSIKWKWNWVNFWQKFIFKFWEKIKDWFLEQVCGILTAGRWIDSEIERIFFTIFTFLNYLQFYVVTFDLKEMGPFLKNKNVP